jgi:hypothetical protein
LTSSLRPCVVEPFEHNDETDGYPEKSLMKKSQDFYKARQVSFGGVFFEKKTKKSILSYLFLSVVQDLLSPDRLNTNTVPGGSNCTNYTNKRQRR